MIFFAVGALMNVPWFYFIKDYRTILFVCFAIPEFISILVLVFFIKDVPISLVNHLTASQVLSDLQYIAKINQKQDFDLTE